MGCDWLVCNLNLDLLCFNSRTPCGVRPTPTHRPRDQRRVSIHAPRVGCDQRALSSYLSELEFQFTHPVWGATDSEWWMSRIKAVSIHAPRVGCDCGASFDESGMQIVSIHAPRVGCDCTRQRSATEAAKFQFTHPVWGATERALSSHTSELQFQFTHPVWGATAMPKGTH